MKVKEQKSCLKGMAFAAKGVAGGTGGTVVQMGRCGRQSRMETGKVRQMLKDGYSVEDIQKYYGYKTKQSVENFLKKNGINMKPYVTGAYREVTAADEGTITALYISGRFSLRETAAELGTSKKLLYEYLQKHPKLLPVRKG